MPPIIIYGEIATTVQDINCIDLLVRNNIMPSKRVRLNISPEGLRKVGRESLDLLLKGTTIVSIDFEDPMKYIAHLFEETPGFWAGIKRNLSVPASELEPVVNCGNPGKIARYEVPGYDRTITLIKNAEDWALTHPLFRTQYEK